MGSFMFLASVLVSLDRLYFNMPCESLHQNHNELIRVHKARECVCMEEEDEVHFGTNANRYIEGKADEYSSKRAWSSIGKQYPEGLTRGVIQVHKQWSRQEQTGRQRFNPIYKAENQEPDNKAKRKD